MNFLLLIAALGSSQLIKVAQPADTPVRNEPSALGWSPQPWGFALRGTFDRSGSLVNCRLETEGSPPDEIMNPKCDFGAGIPDSIIQKVREGDAGSPSQAVGAIYLSIDGKGSPMSTADPHDENVISTLKVQFQIEPNGDVSNCHVKYRKGGNGIPDSLCDDVIKFLPLSESIPKIAELTMILYME